MSLHPFQYGDREMGEYLTSEHPEIGDSFLQSLEVLDERVAPRMGQNGIDKS